MNCESEMDAGTRFLKGKPDTGQESDSPRIEVYVASCFDGTPIILTKTGQLSLCKKQMRTRMLDSISKYEAAKSEEDVLSRLNLQVSDYPNYKPENEDYDNLYTGTENLGDENGERSCFNAGGRVGVGIGLSICVGIGIGVSLLHRTNQGTCQKLQKAAIIAYTILVGLSSPTSSIYALA
ncbi:Uncharacterized protein LOK49_LG10G01226 [Camellia lanceoleosa]|uniref:Uncharacterized protein n=1 Tax=Camellia lanceoleosa TaxID=1840588 RepID=A0ACC0GAR1_9ERIC|nr:Uncharacterized protein LOK49_LG10G01226 [Camellia lanceoleosa]